MHSSIKAPELHQIHFLESISSNESPQNAKIFSHFVTFTENHEPLKQKKKPPYWLPWQRNKNNTNLESSFFFMASFVLLVATVVRQFSRKCRRVPPHFLESSSIFMDISRICRFFPRSNPTWWWVLSSDNSGNITANRNFWPLGRTARDTYLKTLWWWKIKKSHDYITLNPFAPPTSLLESSSQTTLITHWISSNALEC